MIEINLLPEEIKAKKVSSQPTPFDNLVYLLPVVLVIVLITHMYLGIVYATRSQVLAGFEKRWRTMEPQRQEVMGMKSELDASSSETRIVQAYTAKRVLLAPKLNRLSLNLPPGVWFNNIEFGRKDLIVKGSVVSLKSDEIDMINTFLEDLKKDRDFNNDFSSVEVGALQRRTVGSYDVVDFVLTAALSPKQ
jgi:Tfp pilus assembly protein PilN